MTMVSEDVRTGCGPAGSADQIHPAKADQAARELDSIRVREGNSLGYGKTMAKSLGIPYALISLSRSCGLLSDLEEAFGDDGRALLYYAMNKAVVESWDGPEIPHMEDNMSPELLGYDDVDSICDRAGLIETISSKGDLVSHFLDLRAARSPEVYLHDTSLIGTRQSCPSIVLLSDASGVPISYRLMEACGEESLLNMDLGSLIGHSPGDPHLVVCGRCRSAERCDMLRRIGASFLIEIDQNMYNVLKLEGTSISKDVHTYKDKEFTVSTMSIPADDAAQSGCHSILWEVRQKGSESEDRLRVERRIYTIEHRLRSLAPEEAMEQFESTAGRLSRFFDISLKDGKLDLTIRRKDLDEYINPRSRYVLTNDFDTWDEVISAMESGIRFKAASSAMSELISEACATSSRERLGGEVLVDFISLIIRFQMAKILSRTRSGLDVSTALRWLDQLMCIGNGSEWQVVGMTPRNRKVFLALGIEVPKTILL